jgi:hypothetical protein
MKRKVPFVLALLAVLTVMLAVEAGAGEVKFKKYTDKKFGFSVEYPDIYNNVNDPYVDGDGLSTFGAYTSSGDGDGKYAFEVSGGKKPKGADGNSLLKKETDTTEDKYGYVNGVEPIKGTAKSGPDFYTFDSADDSAGPDETTHVYCVVNKTHFVKYWIRYPNADADEYKEITARMDKSLKLK